MSDYLAERLKSHAEEQARTKQAEVQQQNLRNPHEAFICDYARSEYQELVRLLKERVEKIRSDGGNLPEFVVTGSYIQLGHVALYYSFDQPVVNRPDNELILSLGLAPFKQVAFGRPPTPERHKLEAVPGPNYSRIAWLGALGQFDSAELADRALKMLVEYYCRHTKK
jgi:hypothetical protein